MTGVGTSRSGYLSEGFQLVGSHGVETEPFFNSLARPLAEALAALVVGQEAGYRSRCRDIDSPPDRRFPRRRQPTAGIRIPW